MSDASDPPQSAPAEPVAGTEGAKAFAQEIFNLIGHDDVADITLLQTDILERLKQNNQAMAEFNDYAGKQYAELFKDFQRHTLMLKEIQKDVDVVFKRIRTMKTRLFTQYPDAAQAVAIAEPEEDG